MMLSPPGLSIQVSSFVFAIGRKIVASMLMMRGGGALRRIGAAAANCVPSSSGWVQRHTARAFSAGAADEAAVLTREYIYGALYAKDGGYFTTQDREVLHAPQESIEFTNLWGAFDYRREVASLYKEKREAWLTPVEVFAPYYSHAIAKYMLNSPFFHKQMTIYEIGGGAGTNALHILNYLKVCGCTACVCAKGHPVH